MRERLILAIVLGLAICSVANAQGITPIAAETPRPTIAVHVSFDPSRSYGLDPAVVADAMADALIKRLLDTGKFTVLDRAHTNRILSEQRMSAPGQVQPASEQQLGRMLGANYVLVGSILAFRAEVIRAQYNDYLGPYYKFYFELDSSANLIDVNSAEVLQSMQNSASYPPACDPRHYCKEDRFQGAGVGAANAAAPQYLPLLASAAAANFIQKIDTTKLVVTGPAPEVTGRVLDISGADIVISLGSIAGMTQGTIVGVYESKSLKNPDTGKIITTLIKRASLQIIQVEKEYSTAKKISGGPIVKLMVVKPDHATTLQSPTSPQSVRSDRLSDSISTSAPEAGAAMSGRQSGEWREYTYGKDGFAIFAPLRPEMRTYNYNAFGGPVANHFYFFAMERLTGSINVLDWPVPGSTAAEILAKITEQAPRTIAGGNIFAKTPIVLDGNPGVEVLLRGTEVRSRRRYYVVGQRVYQVTSGGPANQAPWKDEDRYLSSFRLLRLDR